VVDVTHDGDHGRARCGGDLVVLVVFVEELGEQRGLLLLPGIDHVDRRADFGGVELDHVVAETLDRGDDLTLQEEEIA